MPSLTAALPVLAKFKIALGQLATFALKCANCSNGARGNRFMLGRFAAAQAGCASQIYEYISFIRLFTPGKKIFPFFVYVLLSSFYGPLIALLEAMCKSSLL